MRRRSMLKSMPILFALSLLFGGTVFSAPNNLMQKAVNNTKTIERVKALSNLDGASGNEQTIRNYVVNQLKDKRGDITVDKLGNVLFGFHTYNPNLKTVLLMAHMDEVGFVITDIDEKGYLRVMPLGGWSQHAIWAHSWRIVLSKGRSITAISGIDPPHILTDFTQAPKINLNQFFLDTGLSSKQLKEKGIRPGLTIVPDVKFKRFGRFYQGKALDDRLGIAALFSVIESLKTNTKLQKQLNIIFAFTTQEELGMRGSKIIGQRLNPDVVLNVEAGIAHDYPMQFTNKNGPQLGKGPSLFIYESSMLPDSELVEYLVDISKRNNIPIQWESEPSYGQDGANIQQSGHGSAAINIGIPVRYAHSHYGIFDNADLINCENLLVNAVLSMPQFISQLERND